MPLARAVRLSVAIIVRDVPDAVRDELAAPSVIELDAANVIRRQKLAGVVSPDQAAQARKDLPDLAIEEWPYELLAGRACELRRNPSIYDASYVALAERLGSTLVTLDQRIGSAPALSCTSRHRVALCIHLATSTAQRKTTSSLMAGVPRVTLCRQGEYDAVAMSASNASALKFPTAAVVSARPRRRGGSR